MAESMQLMSGATVPDSNEVRECLLRVFASMDTLVHDQIVEDPTDGQVLPWRENDYCAILCRGRRPVIFGSFVRGFSGPMCMVRTYSDLTLPDGVQVPLGEERVLKLDASLEDVRSNLNVILRHFDDMAYRAEHPTRTTDPLPGLEQRLLGDLPVSCLSGDAPDPFGLAAALIPVFFGLSSMDEVYQSRYYDTERGTFGTPVRPQTTEEVFNAALDASHKCNPAAVLMGTLEMWKSVPLLAPVADMLLTRREDAFDVGALIYGTLVRWKRTGYDGAPGYGRPQGGTHG